MNVQQNGKRERRFFETEAEALALVAERKDEREKLGAYLSKLAPHDLLEINFALHGLHQAGFPPASTLGKAVDYFLENAAAKRPALNLETLAEEFLESRKLSGRRHRYLLQLRQGLRAFMVGRRERRIDSITTGEIEKWLTSQGWKPRTMRSYLIDLQTMFNFCRRAEIFGQKPGQGGHDAGS